MRPILDGDREPALYAAEALVAELQRGWDARNAETTDASCAADVMWGGPFGAIVDGYDQLHAIHVALKAKRVSPTRFQLQRVLAPMPGVAIVHVKRVALGDGFSEVAMYVLIERAGRWWLAAGQNTKVEPGKSATDHARSPGR
ncbi:MAG TPA: DUF4440 domain-containing protein [Kofleriaceae bacterium]|jgi:uncharacterized protein (TIGR02246 family)|nr:DUF4440 domain-containing protein [Kofleriaceae bacterium]